jgi:ABC-type methionine transport system permease subunit
MRKFNKLTELPYRLGCAALAISSICYIKDYAIGLYISAAVVVVTIILFLGLLFTNKVDMTANSKWINKSEKLLNDLLALPYTILIVTLVSPVDNKLIGYIIALLFAVLAIVSNRATD